METKVMSIEDAGIVIAENDISAMPMAKSMKTKQPNHVHGSRSLRYLTMETWKRWEPSCCRLKKQVPAILLFARIEPFCRQGVWHGFISGS